MILLREDAIQDQVLANNSIAAYIAIACKENPEMIVSTTAASLPGCAVGEGGLERKSALFSRNEGIDRV